LKKPFIDACHEYDFVMEDLKLWEPKAKKLICGHDYDIGPYFGVVLATDEYFGKKPNLFERIWYIEK